jgi:hypothetical protein
MRPVVRQNPHPGDIPTIGTAAGRAPAGSYLSSVVHGPGGGTIPKTPSLP